MLLKKNEDNYRPKYGMAYLSMPTASFDGSGESFINISHSSIHGCFLDGHAARIDVVIGEQSYDLLGNHMLVNY